MQELILAKNLYLVGSTRLIDFEHLALMTRSSSHRREPRLFILWGILSEPMAFVKAIYLSANSQCSDPHDRIYAIQGILKHPLALSVDYSKDTRNLFLEVLHLVLGSGEITSEQISEH